MISVILPVYNAEKYVSEAIQSVLDQTYKDFELIILNDGSTDRSLEIINSFKDERIVLVDQANAGLAKTLNRGLALAKGEYIARMDADDICLPNRFKEQINYLVRHPEVGLLGTAIELIDDEGKHLLYNPPLVGHEVLTAAMMTRGNPMKHPSVMFRKEIAVQCGGYNEDIGKYFEDYMLWRLMSTQCKIDNLPKILLQYRLTPTSIVSTMKNKELDEFVQYVIKKGEFNAEDKKQWLQVLDNMAKNKNIEDRNTNTVHRDFYNKCLDIGYIFMGDFLIRIVSNLKKIKY
ncbi:glycosyltransferase [Chryseobacterium pennipullorum]|uniref:Glycosyl transferase n=1 Tax=Chryseobacterium pennipullorum TaxID=2258963 RepID=A0A3D9B861_9FLAO|nr:glycosyltransferase [Chryseobacterium pennipullorum]REC49609.1 glycosyl transferase [Chryseobacterium pennipullorum]